MASDNKKQRLTRLIKKLLYCRILLQFIPNNLIAKSLILMRPYFYVHIWCMLLNGKGGSSVSKSGSINRIRQGQFSWLIWAFEKWMNKNERRATIDDYEINNILFDLILLLSACDSLVLARWRYFNKCLQPSTVWRSWLIAILLKIMYRN